MCACENFSDTILLRFLTSYGTGSYSSSGSTQKNVTVLVQVSVPQPWLSALFLPFYSSAAPWFRRKNCYIYMHCCICIMSKKTFSHHFCYIQYIQYICDFLGTTAVCSGSNKPALYGREGEG